MASWSAAGSELEQFLVCSIHREKNEKQTVIMVMGLGMNRGSYL